MKKQNKKLTHDECVAKCQDFIRNFQEYGIETDPAYDIYGNRKYMIKMQQIADFVDNRMEIYIQDLQLFFRKDDEKQLLKGFRSNTARYIQIFTDIVSRLMPDQIKKNLSDRNEIKNRLGNMLNEQRKQNMKQNNDNTRGINQSLPQKMLRDYDITIVYGPGSKFQINTISDFDSDKIGSLVVCKAIVIRATQVRPEVVVATYTCDTCGCENYAQVVNDQFSYLSKCQSKTCLENNMNGKLTFLPGHSKFISYQQLKIQQTPQQIKQGQIPKYFSVHLRGSLVKQATPGDIVLIQGILMVHKKKGKKFQNDLSFHPHLQANSVLREKKKYVQMNINEQRLAEIYSIRDQTNDDQIFTKLARSIAPEIYGLQQVKKSLLLLMVGGVTKVTDDNLKIRGQINIALFGDPGIAKSQLLKHISYLAPRGVYTTGKGSSGVGLTAAIVKDPTTQQLALQAGALVLADMGVCCIDQFDKMDQKDRTAIHQVMEQQTISIAKAGITTSLNARTSVLAAANPLYGRYNKAISAHKNINLPAALLSRFDLIFILLDTAEQHKDQELAKHIGMVHKLRCSPNVNSTFTPEFLRAYIAKAKQYEPTLTEQLHHQIINRYIKKRQQQMDLSKQGQNYTTMRSLLALIRLAQARARLRFSNEINKSDITDCLRLIQQSQKSTINSRLQKRGNLDEKAIIYGIIKQLCQYNQEHSVDINTVRKRVLTRGHAEKALQETIKQYEDLNIIMKINNMIHYIDVERP